MRKYLPRNLLTLFLSASFLISSISLHGCGEALITAEEAAEVAALATNAEALGMARKMNEARRLALIEGRHTYIDSAAEWWLTKVQAERIELMESALQRAQARTASQRVELLQATALAGGEGLAIGGLIGYGISDHNKNEKLAACRVAVDRWKQALETPGSDVEAAERAAMWACHED